jgi:ABC-type branched-subunit amino acid transport system ATPase component
LLELRHVDAFYGDSHILQEIDLKVPANGRVAVLGRNGAGKSTLLKSVMNAGPRTCGEVIWNGRSLDKLAAFRRARLGLAMVPEDRRIFSHLTVVENLALAGQALSPGETAIGSDELLDNFAMLKPLQSRFGSQLSGGQQQMLAVARGLAARPELLLLDEPTEGLAPVIVEQLAHTIVEMCNVYGTGLLLSEQNIWFAQRCTNYLYILESGRIVFEGDWRQFEQNPEAKTKYLAV